VLSVWPMDLSLMFLVSQCSLTSEIGANPYFFYESKHQYIYI
jgi:hypothetical protein